MNDDGTTLTIHRPGGVRVVPMSGGPDFEAALPIVARAFGVRPPGPRGGAPPRLFTVQVFASGSEASASRFAAALDDRGVVSEESFFHQECHPCFLHDSHVVEAGADGLHRVIIGVFDPARAGSSFAGELAARVEGRRLRSRALRHIRRMTRGASRQRVQTSTYGGKTWVAGGSGREPLRLVAEGYSPA